MIFIISEDQTLEVVENISDVQRECEGVDVEDGVFLFFNEDGEELVPHFTSPNRHDGFWIFKWVESGKFILNPCKDNPRGVIDELQQVVEMKPNKFFENLNDVKKHFESKKV